MLCRRSCEDDDDLLSSSTVSCGETGSNVLSSRNDCASTWDSAAINAEKRRSDSINRKQQSYESQRDQPASRWMSSLDRP